MTQMKRKAITTILLLFMHCLCLLSQTGKLFNADNHLSSNFIHQVYLDRNGFIWIATRNGLSRYDGYQFHTIKKEQYGRRGMASNYVNCMTQDDNGLFYMGMYGALQSYDGNRFRNMEVRDLKGNAVSCYVTCFLRRKNGEILAGTSGHGLIRITDSGHAVQTGGALGGIHTVHALAEDAEGHIWIVTSSLGLLEYDGRSVRRHFTGRDESGTLRRVCADTRGNIYVGTSNAGVFRREAAGGPFRHIGMTGSRHVAALYNSPHHGKIMIGYDGMGVAVYDPDTEELTDNPFYSNDVDLSESKVYSIAEDASGNTWLGLLQKGIYMQHRETEGFSYMGRKLGHSNVIGQACVVSTLIDSRGRCWVGTDNDGLYCLGDMRRLLHHFRDRFPATVMSIGEDHRGRIWVGSYGEGFGYIDPDGTAYHRYPHYQTANVYDIQCTRDGVLWVGTLGQGLLRIDLKTNRTRAYTMADRAPDHPGMNSIANNYIVKLSVSPDGRRVYTATTMGVCCLDTGKDSWTATFGRNCLNYGTPSRIVKEYGGALWIGTHDGLYRYDMRRRQMRRYTIRDGLADNGIASIEQDRLGRLWMGTNHGLCCLDPRTGMTQNYFADNGLQSNEFSDGASVALDRGAGTVMLFGGVGGITWFCPGMIRQQEWNARVRLVSFIVNNESVSGGTTMSDGHRICDTTVIAADRFELSHRDNTFAIRFSTLTYDNPEHITYLYSINGEEYTRMQPGTNELTISHLPPGTYRFSVKAERNNRTTNEKVFTVVIRHPWWQSWWAYCLYLTALGMAVWQFTLSRRRKERNRLRLQEHIHAEEMGEAKLKFFMNISHEIRTPMTLIITPLLSLIRDEDDPNKRGAYETIRRNAERILSLINQMMDLRKIDKGMMQMRMQETELVAFVKDIHTLFDTQARAKQITLSYEHDAGSLPVWIDRKNFDKVIVNILSNAFKFTPPGGSISIRITHDSRNVTIAISDNGEKIPEDKLDKIFERFYQTVSATNDRHSGTGIGLDLTRSLVELHHGTITARNLQQGCEFTVTIPLGREHLGPEEIMTENDMLVQDSLTTEMEEAEELKPTIIGLSANRRPTLVIAEDDNDIREYLDRELGRDYNVRLCTNGREALAETLHTLPDLIVSDVMMPEMDGNVLCSKVKSNPCTNHIPVILLTARHRDQDRLEGLETGADAYIVKPFNMDILKRTIINLINYHRLLRLKYKYDEEPKEQTGDVKSPDEKLLQRIMSTINSRLQDSDLSVDMIADEVGISRVHLYRKMKGLTGQTPHDVISSIRMKRAATLLANQSMNVTEVMYACGFSSSASFSNLFKKFYGMTPRDYMREHQER